MRGVFVALAALLIAAPAAAQDTAPAAEAEAEVRGAAWHSRQQLYLLNLKAEDGWYFIPGGIRWRYITYTGSQEKPAVSDTVTLHYEGTLIDGTMFDSSIKRGEPATFPLRRLIKGWQMAVPQMGVGETIEVAIPADLAYGPVGSGEIPGGATLLFTIRLIGIDK